MRSAPRTVRRRLSAMAVSLHDPLTHAVSRRVSLVGIHARRQ
jgi:hypothetical protein